MKLKVGDKAPDFTLSSHLDKDVTLKDLRGKTTVLVFFPLAWTPVWTNQIPSYEAEYAKFSELNVQVLGISVDHVPCLKAWADSLEGISYPLMSDFWPHGEVAKKYGVFRSDGTSERAIFIIDKEGIIQYIDIHDIDDQPDNEVLFAELARIQPDVKPAQVVQEEEEEPTEEADIIMYCNRWCPDCRRARSWLARHEIDYVEVDVTRHADAAKKVRGWADGKLVTPTFDINGTIVVNWNESKMKKLLL